MYLRVETNWNCWQRSVPCDGTMVVIGEDNYHSVSCKKCGYGAAGKAPLPEGYIDRLIEEGYIRQIAKRPAEYEDLTRFFSHQIKFNRSAQEIAGDLLERYEVFAR
jgi:hypothetical protein